MTNPVAANQKNSRSDFFDGCNLKFILNIVLGIGTIIGALAYFNDIVEGSTKNINESIRVVREDVKDIQDDIKDLLVATTENKTTLGHIKQVDSKN